MASPEQLHGIPELVGLNERFQLFGPRAEDVRATGAFDVRGTEPLSYRRPLVLNLQGYGYQYPFQIELLHSRSFEVAGTLSPQYPGMGYDITAEDFDGHARIEKLINNVERYGARFSGGLFLELAASNLVNPPEDDPLRLLDRLKLVVDIPGAEGSHYRLVGFPIESEDVSLHIAAFYPADTGKPVSLVFATDLDTEFEELERKYGVSSREYQLAANTVDWWEIALPDIPDYINDEHMTGEFILEEDQSYRRPGR